MLMRELLDASGEEWAVVVCGRPRGCKASGRWVLSNIFVSPGGAAGWRAEDGLGRPTWFNWFVLVRTSGWFQLSLSDFLPSSLFGWEAAIYDS